jgi:hypothetical protein
MIDLTVVAEGKCELVFAKSPIADHLGAIQVFVHPVKVLTSKDNRTSKQYRGGVVSYQQVKADLLRFAKRDAQKKAAWLTTMIDLYALPNDFPGYGQSKTIPDRHDRVAYLEQEFEKDIAFPRFIPYIELHEFEAMLFARPEALSEYYSEQRFRAPVDSLVQMAAGFANPELINDGEQTAPSKRIIAAIPEYKKDKAIAGPQVAQKIGLPRLRERCPHFDAWLTRLEKLGKP